MASMVFVVDTEQCPLSPCHPARARRLLTEGKAAVWRHYPFTIILQRAVPDAKPEPLRVKIDPGSKTTGLALVNDTSFVWVVVIRGGLQPGLRLVRRHFSAASAHAKLV